jgi:hypothetical protein
LLIFRFVVDSRLWIQQTLELKLKFSRCFSGMVENEMVYRILDFTIMPHSCDPARIRWPTYSYSGNIFDPGPLQLGFWHFRAREIGGCLINIE